MTKSTLAHLPLASNPVETIAAARAMVVQSLQRTALERARVNERAMAVFNDHPPYSEEELRKEGITWSANLPQGPMLNLILDGVQVVDAQPLKNVASAETPVNPLRVTCPLCRRLHTVERVEGDTHRCNYSGCFGYTWDEVREEKKWKS